MSQYVLKLPHGGGESFVDVLTNTAPNSKFANMLLIPVGCTLMSAVAFLLHVISTTGLAKRYLFKLLGKHVDDAELVPTQPVVRQHAGFFSDLRLRIDGHGGGLIFAWKILRLLVSVALTALTVVAIVFSSEGHGTIGSREAGAFDGPTSNSHKSKKHHTHNRWLTSAEWTEVSLCVFYVRWLFLSFAKPHLPNIRPIDVYHTSRHTCTYTWPASTRHRKLPSRRPVTSCIRCLRMARPLSVRDL